MAHQFGLGQARVEAKVLFIEYVPYQWKNDHAKPHKTMNMSTTYSQCR